ncbi:MAG: M20 metallopeptidase family protein [Peptostreptococcaceae bacterium]
MGEFNIEKIKKMSNEIRSWVIEVRRELHKIPELGMEEYETNKKIKKYLSEIGIEYKESNDNYGIMAHIIKPNAKQTIAIRADMDALPIQEKNQIDYKSIYEGKMHACGHDAHMAILLGTCKLLHEMKDELNINVKFLFQPAEENVGGARFLIENGCLENPKVDYIFGLHVQPYLQTSYIECKEGVLNAIANSFLIKIKGKRAHGAYPDEGIDALVTSAQVITMIQNIISRELPPQNLGVITLGKIQGGDAQNIICEEVQIEGTIRVITIEDRNFIVNRLQEIVENTSRACRCEGEVEIDENWYPPLVNNKELVEIIKNNTQRLLGEEKYITKEKPSLGGEDFSFYTQYSKGAFFHLGCGGVDENIENQKHTSLFNIDEECLSVGVMMHLMNTLYFN